MHFIENQLLTYSKWYKRSEILNILKYKKCFEVLLRNLEVEDNLLLKLIF